MLHLCVLECSQSLASPSKPTRKVWYSFTFHKVPPLCPAHWEALIACGWKFLTKMVSALEVVFHFVIPSRDNELLGDSSKGTILPCTNLLEEALSVPRARPEKEMTMASWRVLWLGFRFVCPSCCQFALKCETVLEGHGKIFTFKPLLSQSKIRLHYKMSSYFSCRTSENG